MSGTTQNCHVLADFSIIPMGAGTNTTKGNYDQVMCAVRKCIDKMHEMGAPRCDTNIRLNTRTDKSVTMQDSIRVVTDKIAAETNANV
ncbi:5141_t:CDS:2 [Rhizophagus irregularis]|nr:5141_t:CDS:2 [Rhizophagus irregularis]